MENNLNEWYKLHKEYRYYDYTTKDLAHYLKVSTRTIQRWITGKTHPSKDKIQLIKKYLAQKVETITLRRSQ